MAGNTKCAAIVYGKTEFREQRKRLYMVSVELHSVCLARTTGVVVSFKDSFTPKLIFQRVPYYLIYRSYTPPPQVAVRAASLR